MRGIGQFFKSISVVSLIYLCERDCSVGALQPLVDQPVTVVLAPALVIDGEYWHRIATRSKTNMYLPTF